MSIKSELSILKVNIQNAKDKLYTNLVDKGVTDITTASTLDAMADSVSNITVGGGSEGGNLSFVFENNIRINDFTEWLNYVDISKLTSISYMFDGVKYKTLDLRSWDVSKIKNMYSTFSQSSGLTSLDVSNWNTSAVTNMDSLFNKCSGLTSLDVSNWNTSAVTNMSNMFGYFSMSSLDLSGWNISSVTKMEYMFKYSSFKSINLSGWDFNASPLYMFYNCTSLESVDFSNCNTERITSYSYTFNDCKSLKKVEGFLSLKSVISNIGKTGMIGWSVQNELRKITFKDLGYNNDFTSLNMFNFNVWGVNSDTITDARQSLVDSLITYSFDRATNGYSTCTVTLAANTKAVLTDDEIAQITAKGFTIA